MKRQADCLFRRRDGEEEEEGGKVVNARVVSFYCVTLFPVVKRVQVLVTLWAAEMDLPTVAHARRVKLTLGRSWPQCFWKDFL